MKLTFVISSLALALATPVSLVNAQGTDGTIETCKPFCKALFPGNDGGSLEARQRCIIDCLQGGTDGGQTPPPPPPPPGCTVPATGTCPWQ
jgi:hypothetical protein